MLRSRHESSRWLGDKTIVALCSVVRKLKARPCRAKPSPGCDLFADLRALSRGHSWTRAAELLEQALELAQTHPAPALVNERSYGTAIAACDRASLWQQAIRFLARANLPNLILWNATISACSRARRWTTACALLEQMPRAKLWPDVITFNSTMRAFAWHRLEYEPVASSRLVVPTDPRESLASQHPVHQHGDGPLWSRKCMARGFGVLE